MSDAYYTLHIAGLERQLKRFPVSDSMDIAAFIFFGDVELTKACAEELLKKVPEFDYIVTPEAKSIPLAYEMSRQSGKKYIVARKGVKVYMDRPEKVTVHSITTQKEQTLYLGHEDGDLLVVNKPKGMVVHPWLRATLPIEKTLFSWKNYLCSSNNRAEVVLWEAFKCCQIRRKWPL